MNVKKEGLLCQCSERTGMIQDDELKSCNLEAGDLLLS